MDILSFQLIFFDFDGLLADTERLHYAAYLAAFDKYNLRYSLTFREYESYAHAPSPVALKEYIQHLNPHLSDEIWQEVRKVKIALYQEQLHDGALALMPYAGELITYLESQKKAMCVVTNTPCAHTTIIRAHHPILNKIPTWVTREDYLHPKPATDGYLKGLSLFPAYSAKDSVGLEDTLRGAAALKGAGITPILVCSNDHPQLNADHRLFHIQSLGVLAHLDG